MEAPRHLRVWGVRKLPELIGKIIKDAGDFTSKIEAAAQTVTELSNQIAQLTDDSPDAGTSVQLVQQQTKTPEVLPAQKNPVALAQPNAFSFDVTLALQQAEIQQTITDTIKAFEATQQAIKDAVDQASAQYRFQTLSAVTMPAGTPPVRSLPVRRRR
jgi:septal ring factor EnvC (AmiA/AmiB activator)